MYLIVLMLYPSYKDPEDVEQKHLQKPDISGRKSIVIDNHLQLSC